MKPCVFFVALDVVSSANNWTEHTSKHKRNSTNAYKKRTNSQTQTTQKRTKPNKNVQNHRHTPHTKRTRLFFSSAGSTCRPLWFSSFPEPGAQCGQMEAEAMRSTWKKQNDHRNFQRGEGCNVSTPATHDVRQPITSLYPLAANENLPARNGTLFSPQGGIPF